MFITFVLTTSKFLKKTTLKIAVCFGNQLFPDCRKKSLVWGQLRRFRIPSICLVLYSHPEHWAVSSGPKVLFFRQWHRCRSQWLHGLRRGSEAARLLRFWFRIPPEAWMFVFCECCVLWGRGLCDELITRPEESYRLCCVVVCDLETSRIGAT